MMRTAPEDRNDPRCWNLGVFSFNLHDPDLVAPRRRGNGETFNFARPGSWLFFAFLLGVPAAVMLIVVIAQHH